MAMHDVTPPCFLDSRIRGDGHKSLGSYDVDHRCNALPTIAPGSTCSIALYVVDHDSYFVDEVSICAHGMLYPPYAN